jgi:glycine hydroxymethyltransferase
VSDIVATALLPGFDDSVRDRLRSRASALAAAYPLYPGLS